MRTEKLPLLPRAAVDEHNLQGGRLLYTPAQMRAYGLACYQQGLEDAAKAAGPEDSYRDEWFSAKADSVAKIRALAKEITP